MNTGPLMASERRHATDLPGKRDIEWIAPEEVVAELEAGIL